MISRLPSREYILYKLNIKELSSELLFFPRQRQHIMSNYLAIATVTATMQRILQAAISNDFTSANVTTLAPNNLVKSETQKGANIYLYQVVFNLPIHSILEMQGCWSF